MKPMLINMVEAAIVRAAGRHYQIELERLDERSLRELVHLLRDLDGDKRTAVSRARIMPWRRA